MATWRRAGELPGKAGRNAAVALEDGRAAVLASGARGFLAADGAWEAAAGGGGSVPAECKGIARLGGRLFLAGKGMREQCLVADAGDLALEAARGLQPPFSAYGLAGVAGRLLAVGWGYLEEVAAEGCAVREALDPLAAPSLLQWAPAAVLGTPTGQPPRAGADVAVAVDDAPCTPQVLAFSPNEHGTGLEVAVLDTASMLWHRPLVGGVDPGALTNFSVAVVGRKALLYGGLHFAEHIICRQANPNVYALDLDTFAWEILETEGEAPPTRFNHSAVALGNSMMVLGGTNELLSLKDVWRLDLD